ncbi:RDD family protein [Algirhabdus cladophorae]|uniref:RDD family protein n=1 Tax=Algirhabdus cladophorae TaxID=3377108 RepID=UPI003B84631B
MSILRPDPIQQPEFYDSVPMKRLLAWVLDTAIIVALSFGVALLTFGIGFFMFLGLMVLVGMAYRVVTLANGSATWGMRVAAIEMRGSEGQKFDLTLAILHSLGFYISFSALPLQVISIVLMLTTERKQGLTDMILGTFALNKAAETRLA